MKEFFLVGFVRYVAILVMLSMSKYEIKRWIVVCEHA